MVRSMIKESIVVEGIHDKQKLESIFGELSVIMTNGSEISNETINLIKNAESKNGVILFLDPDGPGDLIRKKIEQYVPNVKHAFLRKEDCISSNSKKIGIEHASSDVIIKALSSVYTISEKSGNKVTLSDIQNLGLIGKENSNKLRNDVSVRLNLGLTNGKTFLKRINQFDIEVDEILKIIKESSD